MPKRRAPWQGTRSGGRAGTQFYGSRWGGGAGRRPARGRFSGYYRKSGYYGRYNGQGGKPELKFHDVQLDDAVITTSGAITPTVNIIAQDVTESTRVGRKCTIRGIQWRYRLELPEYDAQATAASGDICRVIMYLDKQCNGATATALGLLESDNYLSFNNLANKSRFRILHDKTHVVNYTGMASDGAGLVSGNNVFRNVTFYKKCSIPLEFDDSAATGALTTIRSNNIGVLLITAAGVMGMESKIRLRFSDS